MDLTFRVPMQYFSLQHRTLLPSPVIPTTGCVFALAPSLQSFWSYFSTDLQQPIGHLLTWGLHLLVSYLFAFSNCSWGSQGRNSEVVCHSLLQGPHFARTLHHDLSILGGPTRHASQFHWVRQGSWSMRSWQVVHVIRLVTLLWLWFLVCLPSDGEG